MFCHVHYLTVITFSIIIGPCIYNVYVSGRMDFYTGSESETRSREEITMSEIITRVGQSSEQLVKFDQREFKYEDRVWREGVGSEPISCRLSFRGESTYSVDFRF